MAESTKPQQTRIDADRGIHGVRTTQGRYADAARARLPEESWSRRARAERGRGDEAEQSAQVAPPPAPSRVRAPSRIPQVTSRYKKPLMKVPAFVKFFGISQVVTLYFFQLLFATLSLIFLGFLVSLGSLLSWIINLISWFPAEHAFTIFWILSMIPVFICFFGMYFWLRLNEINPLETFVSAFITVGALAASLTPGPNMLPWLLLMYIYFTWIHKPGK